MVQQDVPQSSPAVGGGVLLRGLSPGGRCQGSDATAILHGPSVARINFKALHEMPSISSDWTARRTTTRTGGSDDEAAHCAKGFAHHCGPGEWVMISIASARDWAAIYRTPRRLCSDNS